MSEVKTDVLALVFVDVDGDFPDQMNGLAVGRLKAFQVGREDIVRFASWDALGEFSHVIRVDLPADLFRLVAALADSYGDAIDGAIVGSPDGAGDQGVGLASGLLSEQAIMGTEGGDKKENKDCNDRQRAGAVLPSLKNSHRLRSPPLRHRRLLRSLLRRPSTLAD